MGNLILHFSKILLGIEYMKFFCIIAFEIFDRFILKLDQGEGVTHCDIHLSGKYNIFMKLIQLKDSLINEKKLFKHLSLIPS